MNVGRARRASSSFFEAMNASQVQELFQDRLNIEGLLKHRLYKASLSTHCMQFGDRKKPHWVGTVENSPKLHWTNLDKMQKHLHYSTFITFNMQKTRTMLKKARTFSAQGLDLSGFEKLNDDFRGSGSDVSAMRFPGPFDAWNPPALTN